MFCKCVYVALCDSISGTLILNVYALHHGKEDRSWLADWLVRYNKKITLPTKYCITYNIDTQTDTTYVTQGFCRFA